MALTPTHLIERAAERLRNTAGGPPGLAAPAAPSSLFRPPAPPALPVPPASTLGIADPETVQQRLADPVPEPASPLDVPSGVLGVAGVAGVSGGLPAETRAETALAASLAAPLAAPGFIDFAALERAGLVVGRKARTRISEEFRISVGQILRTVQTAYSSGNASANLLMVTSARPGEGKSFSALNIAGSIAQHGQREVLLVDVDAKQRPITHELGLGEARGLLDLAANPALRAEDVIVRTAIPNLSVIPIGTRLPDHDIEAATTRPISAVVERLGRRFANRVILLDAPPCLSTSDPSALAPLVGQIIMVVEAERTQRNEVEAAFDLIKSCPTITLLLNKIKLTTSYTFGAYHYFGSYS